MTIDVFADIACPWCYIGERRLFAALAQRPDLDVQPRWRPFQLQPDLPAAGLPWRPFAEQKFGGWERAQAGFRHVAAAAEADGIVFDFEHIANAANTTDAHRLVLFARENDLEWKTASALFHAYFTEGRNLNVLDDLLTAASAAGLDPQQARDYLASDAGRLEVRESQEAARRLGITGVPCTVFDYRFALSGAQPVEVFVQALDEMTSTYASSNV